MRGLSKRLASLSPQQRELLQHRLKDRGLAASNLPILPRTEKRSSFPLTFAQERVWFLHQMEPEDPAYHIAVSRRLQGPLDVAALQRTFGEIVRRHESLRSGFSAVDGKPLQVVRPAPGLRIPRIDLSRLPESRQHAETRRLLREQNRRPFDLVCDPLLRCSLFRLTAEDHVLALSLHHIVTDGWSMEVLLREVQTLYEAFARGRPSPLPELPIQYGDFVLWQRQRVDGQLVADQLAYWRQQLAGLPPRLDLPTDRPRPAIRSYRGSVRGIALGAELTSALKTLSRSEETTLFVALLAVFKLLLGRTSGQPDLCVGIPISGRDRVEIEGLIGFFANTLVVRSSTLGGSTFGDFLSRVHRAVLDAHKHQDLPFERLVEELQPERSLSYPSIFQVMFAMQPRRLQAPVPDGSPSLNIAPYRSELAAATYDLSLEVVETGAGIRGVLSYNTDLFDATTVARMLSHLKALLEAVVVDPERRISDLPMLSPPERQALLREWNATASSPAEACAHQLFEAQAEQAPEAVALVWGERWLTYRELNRRANRLARALRGRGVAPEVVVGVLLERSPELVTAVLGVLKAGGAYLPLDPAQPAKRLAFMVDDAGVPILVTEPPLSQELRLESSPAVIGLDGAGSLAAGSEEAPSLAALRGNLTGGAVGENLAYLIYTSGSTGRPKGTELRHAGLLNLITWHQEVYRVAPGDRATLVASPGFDASVWEIWPNLTAGATLHIPASSTVASPPDLLAWLAARGITLSFLPTPLAEALLTEPLPPRLSLRALLTGGDKLHHSPERALPFDLVNHYGPTESTVVTSWTPVAPGESSPPIGRPLTNTRVYLLTAGLQPVPLGVPGELHVGGLSLARGYRRRRALTAERFIPDPLSDTAGGRLYKTGDRVRYQADGQLEFLGRLDHQVKVRGFRIELGEIEAVLGAHPAVDEAVVTVRSHDQDRLLVAYVVARQGELPPPSELRRFLRARLPDYMVPGAFTALPELPLSPSGKVDRAALPTPDDTQRQQLAAGFEPPRTPMEERLALLWGEVLTLDRVGVRDNFFELGGHSLLATQMLFRLREDFGVELPLRSLFEGPTVAEMVRAIGRLSREAGVRSERTALPKIEPAPEERHLPFPLTDIQEAYWIGRSSALELGSVSSHAYLELDLPGLDVERLSRAFRRLIDHHDMLRAVIEPDGLQRILPQVPPYEIALSDLTGEDPDAAEKQLSAVREAMSHQVLASDRWPLFELRASRLDRQRVRLHISFDALIFDAWSQQILVRQLSQLYRDPQQELPPLELSFRDYVLAEVALRETEIYRRDLEYWHRRLRDLPPAPELPLAKDPAAVENPRFGRRRGRLPREQWTVLRRRAARAGLTPSGVFLAAFAEILGTWSKSPRFTINVTLFNRRPLHPQVDQIIGDFTSLTLLGVDVGLPGTFKDHARRVQQQLWEDLDHRLVSAVQVLRELSQRQSERRAVMMPVVFTSALHQAAGEDAAQDASEDESGEKKGNFGISQTPQVWVDCQITEAGGKLIYVWDAVEELFPAGLLDAMFDAFGVLVAQLADDEQSWRQQALELLPAAQREQRAAVNATEAPLPPGLLHEGFMDQARQHPARVAVIAPDRSVTYGELLAGACRLGRQVRQAGAQPNRLVAVVMEKGWEQVLAVLGILESGAAYLPIDPALPRERRETLLAHGEVEIVLTQPPLDAELEWPATVRRIRVGMELLEAAQEEPPERVQRPEDLAYVIFTSGSTGQPKGVMIDHRGALNTVVDINQRFAVAPEDRVLALSNLNFDLSVYDIFGPLAAGAAVVVPAASARRDPEHWAELIARHQVTIWNSVPALMEMLVESAAGRSDIDLSALRLVMMSGDWIPTTLPQRIRELVGNAQIISLGGATEASIWSILFPIAKVPREWPSIPYGKPMRNQSFHVLDGSLRPRPVWVPGDLYIGGIGLARGYWRDPEKTRASFLLHPQTRSPLYRTGDLGRYLPDGNIEFLGREDFQVKIRGHRIELGEIEAALLRIEEVRSAVVATVGPERGYRQLVAYVVADREPFSVIHDPSLATAPLVAEPPTGELGAVEFRLREPGLRRDPEDTPTLRLFVPERDRRFLAPFVVRRSHREFCAQPLPLESLGRVLGAMTGRGGLRPYPSADGRYTVEILVYVKPQRLEHVAAGVYRWRPKLHRLELLSADAELTAEAYAELNRPIFEQAALAVFFMARREALAVYGERAQELALIEAGAMSQLLMEVAPADGIGFCPIGGVKLDELASDCGPDGSYILLYSLLGGGIAGASAAPVAAPPKVLDDGGIELIKPAVAEGVLRRFDESLLRREMRDGPISHEAFGKLLGCLHQVSLAEFPFPKYRYPSAGNLYPVQTYVVVGPGRVADVDAGVYYYHPKAHRLVQLKAGSQIGAEDPAFSLFLVGKLSAIAPLYGDLARPFCQLEAGSMSQLLRTAGAELDLGLRSARRDLGERLLDLLELDEDHVLLLGLQGAPVAAERLAAEPVEGAVLDGLVSGTLAAAATGDLIARLRTRLEQTLPEYMVPSAFIPLDELPLTPNGKVDRKALPEPDNLGDGAAQTAYVAPRNETERTIAGLWQEVIGGGARRDVVPGDGTPGRHRVGIHDDFFELGGHSLHAVQLANKLRATFEVELPLDVLFTASTVAELAETVVRSLSDEVDETELAAALAELEGLSDQEMEVLVGEDGDSDV